MKILKRQKDPSSLPTDSSNGGAGNKLKLNHTSKRTIISLTVVLLVILACVIGYLYHSHHQSANKTTLPQDHHTYSNLSSHSLSGAAAGEGINFKLPTDFIDAANKAKPSKTDALFLQHSKKTSYLTIGYAYASSIGYTNSSAPPSDDYLKTLNDGLNSSDAAVIKSQTKIAYALLTPHLTLLNINVQSLKAFTNANIKSGAWVADFTAKTREGQPLYQGQMVYDVTKKATYNFQLYAADYNWNDKANQDTWKQVLDSLKVDQ